MSESGWQPIETAPRDGTFVDLWVKEWEYTNDTFTTLRLCDCSWEQEQGWVNDAGDPLRFCFPTHWMPMPEPPVTP